MPLLKRGSKRQGTRLYVVSDFHASDPAWRKLLNAIRLNAYKADTVLYAGDLTGKAMVPIVAVGGDRHEATLLGQRRVARDEKELAALERDVAGLGYYAFRTTKEEVDALGGDQAKLDALFSREIRARVKQWLDLRSEEHTSELQSHVNLVCRLLLEKKKKKKKEKKKEKNKRQEQHKKRN